METVCRITDMAPDDLAIVERLFGLRLDPSSNAVIVQRTPEAAPELSTDSSDELPDWCNVLEGMSDEDREELRAIIDTPFRIGHAPIE